MFVKPYCLIPGSFPNLLVYLPRAQRVKKARGMVTERGKVIHLFSSSLSGPTVRVIYSDVTF